MKDMVVILVAILVSFALIDSIKDYKNATMMYNRTMEEVLKHPSHVYDELAEEYAKDLSDEEIIEILGL